MALIREIRREMKGDFGAEWIVFDATIEGGIDEPEWLLFHRGFIDSGMAEINLDDKIAAILWKMLVDPKVALKELNEEDDLQKLDK